MLVHSVTKSNDGGIGIASSRFRTFWSDLLPSVLMIGCRDCPAAEAVVGWGDVGTMNIMAGSASTGRVSGDAAYLVLFGLVESSLPLSCPLHIQFLVTKIELSCSGDLLFSGSDRLLVTVDEFGDGGHDLILLVLRLFSNFLTILLTKPFVGGFVISS